LTFLRTAIFRVFFDAFFPPEVFFIFFLGMIVTLLGLLNLS
jgi:hypothetical protein